MKLVGHKTESVYRRYAIVADGEMRDAAAKLDGATEGNRDDAKLFSECK